MTHAILAKTYTWWRDDELPPLTPLPEFRCDRVADVPLLARLHHVEPVKIEARLEDANTAYIAYIEDQPAAYGWSGAKVDNNASKRGIEKAGFQLVNFVVFTPERQLRLVPQGNRARSHDDPQGRHFGFIAVADAEMIVFNFGDLADDDLELSS